MKDRIDRFVAKWAPGSEETMTLELMDLLRHAITMEREAIAARMEAIRDKLKKGRKK